MTPVAWRLVRRLVFLALAATFACAPAVEGRASVTATVLRQVIAKFFHGESWRPWRTAAAAVYALPPESDDEVGLFQRCTGRSTWPTTPAREAWFVVGRRGGKSAFVSRIGVIQACFRDYRSVLAPGEFAIGMVLAADRAQARVDFRYMEGVIDAVPVLTAKVARRTRERLELDSRVALEVHTCSYRTLRGRTTIFGICDELAFWRDDTSANPDAEVLNALRPAMATVPGALLLCASTPYAKRGALYMAFTKHHGREDDRVLVWRADSRTMNPTLDEQVIAEAYETDPAVAASEYGAEFRSDIESLFAREALDAVVARGRFELPPVPGVRYIGFIDPSGGSSDSMSLAIAHAEEDRAVLDAIRERRPPFSPQAVVEDFAAILRTYGVTRVTSDRFGGAWVSEAFRKHGVAVEPAALTKSDLYRELLPLINSGRVELLDNPRLLTQLTSLERRTSRSGKDSIDHGPGSSHDDLGNAAAGALVLAGPGLIEAVGLLRPPEPHFRQPLMFERPWSPSRIGSRLERLSSRWGRGPRHADDH